MIFQPKARSLVEGGFRHAELRGLWLSHLIGLSFFFQFVFSRVITMELPFTKLTDLPIRMIAIWLLVDRVGRRGKVKIHGWDYVHLGFAAIYGFLLVFADSYMIRETGFQNYITWVLMTLNPYFYFVIAREGTLRRGFDPYIVIRWILFTIAVCCVIALAQASNIAGMRERINEAVHQKQAELRMEGPSQPWQARGVFAHANAMAIMLVMGIALLVGATNYRKPGAFEFACGGLFLLTLFATFSRTGIVSIFILALAMAAILAFQRKIWAAAMVVVSLLCLSFAFITIVYVFSIERYEVFLKGEGSVKKQSERGLYGVYQRQESLKKAIELGTRYPLTGVNVATSAINEEMVIYKSAYTFEGLLLNVYGFTFVSYGLPGLLFLGGVLYMGLAQMRFIRTRLAFAPVAVLCAVAIMITGITENTLWQPQHMMIVNLIMAFAIQRLIRDTEKQTEERTELWARLIGFNPIRNLSPVARAEALARRYRS